MEANDSEKDPQQDSGATPEDANDLPNLRLRKAREDRGMNVDEVAHELHLDRNVILAIETGEFDSLGAPVFVRGYLRSYARLLELPEDEIVAAIDSPEFESEEFRTLSAPPELRPGANLVNFALWAVLGFVALAGLIYLVSGDEREPAVSDVDTGEFVAPDEPDSEGADEAKPESESLPEAGELEGEVVDEAEVAEEVESEMDSVSAPEPPAEPEPLPAPEPEPEPEPPVAEVPTYSLKFTFSEECWVEISGADKRLLYGLEKPGSIRQVEGRPPFKMFVGNAAVVALEINGELFDIPGSRQPGRTARFSISSDQLLELTGDE